MSDNTDPEVKRIEEVEAFNDWDPIDPHHRTDRSPVQRAYERILDAVKRWLRAFDVD